MNPQDSYDPPVKSTVNNPLAVMQSGEQVICEIRRHPVGIIGMYVAVGFLLFIIGSIVFIAAPSLLTNYSNAQVMSIGVLVFVVAALIGAGFLFLAGKVYWGNSWVVTTDSITQIKRISLFDKQSSQLSLGNLEDVTAEQNGMLAQMFHFGVISAETAGAQDRFVFPFCPNPTYYAQKILAAREHFRQGHNEGGSPAPATPGTDLPGPG
jgi:hypothetical protein